MRIVYVVCFFVIGLIFGSFYNVVGFRLPQKKSIIKPRSACPKCSHILKWYELIPIVSFVIQKGKCKNCGNKISLFYPFTELITGLLFAVAYFIFGFSGNLIVSLLIISFLSIVIVSDLNYMIIPNEVTITFCLLLILTKLIFFGVNSFITSLLSGIAMFILMYLIMLVGNFIFKKESLGGGDIKLMFFIGLTLNPILSIVNVFVGSLIALPAAIYLQVKKNEKMIPYGPFLLIGNLFVFLTKIDIEKLKVIFIR